MARSIQTDPAIAGVRLAMLEILGCRVDVMENAHEVLEALPETDYDLVLMDCQMPEMDGVKATEKIREPDQGNGISQRVPIIALTANATEGDRENCLAGGMDGYLSKPFDEDQLQTILERWVTA